MSGIGARSRFERAGGLASALHLTEPRRSFGLVLAAIIAAVVFQLAAPDTNPSHVFGIFLQGAVIVLALRAAGASPRVVNVATLSMAVVIVAAGLALLGPVDVARAVPRVLTLTLILLAPTAVVAGVIRELHEDRRVTVQTMYCGVCLYLLLGMAFALLFGAIGDISGEPFFNYGVAGTTNDFLYFSLATLTTTGYGDFSAATELGRAMAVTEALMGQIYLVTVLAVIVSNIGRLQGRSNA